MNQLDVEAPLHFTFKIRWSEEWKNREQLVPWNAKRGTVRGMVLNDIVNQALRVSEFWMPIFFVIRPYFLVDVLIRITSGITQSQPNPLTVTVSAKSSEVGTFLSSGLTYLYIIIDPIFFRAGTFSTKKKRHSSRNEGETISLQEIFLIFMSEVLQKTTESRVSTNESW